MPRKKTTKAPKTKQTTGRSRTKKLFSRPRGMKDVLFREHRYWDLVMKKANELGKVYGFRQIQTPVLETFALFEKILGKNNESLKELYNFTDSNGEKVVLRSRAVPSLARVYMEQNMEEASKPIKLFWVGPVFQDGNFQFGRFKQSTQIDLNILGDENPVSDFLLMLVAYNFFKELQIDVQIQINSLGCADCMAEYKKKLDGFYKERGKKTKLCNICKKKAGKDTMALLRCQETACAEVREGAPQVVDFLCEGCKENFIKVLEYLDELDIPYNLNPYLNHMDNYYNGTVFEICVKEDSEQTKDKMVLASGGRYNSLIEDLGGAETPAVGLSINVEKTVAKIKEKNIPLKKNDNNIVFVAQLGDQARRKAFSLFEELRRANFCVRQSFTKNSLKAQLDDARNQEAKIALIIGQKELMEDVILIRDMESGIQEVIDYKKVKTELEKRLNK